ncbi:MAG TPA: hypothetical protein VGP26_14520 [Actinophytocola sp.]|nr:hypothetical protein [Actinophytocola sp.]
MAAHDRFSESIKPLFDLAVSGLSCRAAGVVGAWLPGFGVLWLRRPGPSSVVVGLAGVVGLAVGLAGLVTFVGSTGRLQRLGRVASSAGLVGHVSLAAFVGLAGWFAACDAVSASLAGLVGLIGFIRLSGFVRLAEVVGGGWFAASVRPAEDSRLSRLSTTRAVVHRTG